MTTKVPDREFPSVASINSLECFTADRYLNKVDEIVRVTRCCIDPNDTNLVIIDFALLGAFLFVPYCKILRVDEDSYEDLAIFAPLIESHPSSASIPIDTECSTFHGQLVYDFSAVIPNFLSAVNIEFELGMVGTVPQSYGITFPSQTPTDTFVWNKGIMVRPISLNLYNGNVLLEFQYDGTRDCSCNIQCTTMSGVTHQAAFCPGQSQQIVVFTGALDGSPQDLLVQFRDSIGNTTNLNIQGMLLVDPRKPIAVYDAQPRRVEVSISNMALNGATLSGAEYQIFKYEGRPSNYSIWKDWSHRNWSTFIDYTILPGKEYGYSVRYKGKYNDISNISDWTVISV